MKESRKHNKASSQPFLKHLLMFNFFTVTDLYFQQLGQYPDPQVSSDTVGNSLGLMWPRSAWKNEVW